MNPILSDITTLYDRHVAGAEAVILESQVRKARELIGRSLRYVAPPPDMTTAEWAEAHIVLSSKISWRPGKWHNDTMPWLTAFMDALDDPELPLVTVEKASRMGFTTALNAYFGRRIHHDPCPMMYVQQTLGEGKKYSRKILAEFIEYTPVLRDILPKEKSRQMGNTILEKDFPGGSLTIVGANVPTGFRMVFSKVLALDDVDGFELLVGEEGDPVENAIGRVADQWDGKVVMISKPTTKDVSRIHNSYEKSDKRLYYVPCPHCGASQQLVWGGKDIDHGIKWTKGDPESAYYLCISCHSVIREHEKHAMLLRGGWRPTAAVKGHAGFGGLSQLYHPGIRWSSLVSRYLRVYKTPEQYQVFINDSLGEVYDPALEGMDKDSLFLRREPYGPELPEGVCLLTASVDVNGTWLEASIDGWGRGEECWNIDHSKFDGDPALPDVWEAVDAFLLRTFAHPSGVTLRVAACAVDSGYLPDIVASWVRARARSGRNIVAVKGDDAVKGKKLISDMPAKKDKYKLHVYLVNSVSATRSVFARLAVAKPGPKYCHFPLERTEEYFDGLLAERFVPVVRGGHVVTTLKRKPGVRNEPLDLRKYNLAMLEWMKQHRRFDLDRMADDMLARMARKREQEQRGPQPEAPPVPELKRTPPKTRESWVTRWRK